MIEIAAGEAPAASVAAAAILRSREGQIAVGRAANAALDASAFDRVLALSDRVVGADASFVNAWWWQAQARRSLGDADGALADLQHVEALMPEFAPLFGLRSEILAGRHDYDGAVTALERAVSLEPADMRAQQMLWTRSTTCGDSTMPKPRGAGDRLRARQCGIVVRARRGAGGHRPSR